MLRLVVFGLCVVFFANVAGGCAMASSGGPPDAGRDGDAPVGADAPAGTQVDAAVDAAAMSCAGADTCQAAMMLGSVSGDTQGAKLTASGHRGGWYHVRVSEDNNALGGVKLRVAAKLTAPTPSMFDVVVYVNAGTDVVECATMTGTSSTTGSAKQVRAEWGEGGLANGSNDGRTISIEVRPLAADGCSPSATWQLEVEGDWK